MSKPSGFARIDRQLWRSEQWRALSPSAQVVLIDIQCGYNGHNNGAIHYGLTHAMTCLRCSKSTAMRAIAELQGAGLIEAVSRGSFTHKAGSRKGQVSTWRLPFLTTKQPKE